MLDLASEQMLLALSNNALEVFDTPRRSKMTEGAPEATRVFSVDIPGHRTDVRTVCLSSNDELLASGSNGETRFRSENVRPSTHHYAIFAQAL